ncbi:MULTISPECIES: hypothetical protein [Pseudomonas aeruginosa group]|uniref:Membrane protein n=1 Tax=Pseudomonas paraeruginosa TaxID=2994495 RepID=A0A2R3J149_9PSED|nr:MULTISPECIES: hypothetical protein [Pseudomonas aeruginosa group]VTS18973.1 Uncharacterised protein [Streptococcus dysgalactiae subsp. equisimilis]AVK07890.1 putative membrane protein [Pseudomonas paraeruginosa]AVR68036.1 hypothetical protein B7D75_14205 [Pseudomonas paraeruginosa]AWE94206.1 putative membrane protein [Pseudomonas paraeruginosa]KAB0742358.1 hypothetical protein F7O94_23265 [Pseudomonas aeruginosa]
MSGPDALSQACATLLLALAFSAFILFVRGYRPAGVRAAWYDLVLAFIAVWLGFWPEAGVLANAPNLDNALGLALQVGATVGGCVLGYGVAKGLRRAMRETRRKRSASSPSNR